MVESTQTSKGLAIGVLRTFAVHHRLKVRLDSCGDPVIAGRHGEIGEHGDGRLNACFHGTGPEPFSRVRAGRIRRTLALDVGELISGDDGADEALFAFNCNDLKAARWFIDSLHIRRRRSVSPETAERLRQFARMRKTIAGRPLHARKTPAGMMMALQAGGDRNDCRKGPVAQSAHPAATRADTRDLEATQRIHTPLRSCN